MSKMLDEPLFISRKEATNEIGTDGLKRLREFQRRLIPTSGFPLAFRYAPSIITRSEAELFGLSSPRFAIRAYLTEDYESFVNTRRLRRFSDAITSWGRRTPPGKNWKHAKLVDFEIVENVFNAGVPADLVRTNNCIADAVLVPPANLRRKYTILTVELGRSYGEGKEIHATPFVRHIAYSGGGLCAQAVCFMASVLLRAYPSSLGGGAVHGVAEVTAVVAPQGCNEFLIRGLSWHEMVNYFIKTGKSAYFQRPGTRFGLCPREQSFTSAIRSYVLSGMPVIPLVNISRMASIHRRNGLRFRPSSDEQHKLNHAVLLVGCDEHSERFLVNDPATFPFLEAPVTDLWDAGVCTPHNAARPGRFIAVTPAAVKTPLETWIHPVNRHAYCGLFAIAQLLQQEHPASRPALWPRVKGQAGKYHSGDWRLGTLQRLAMASTTPADMRKALSVCTAKLNMQEDKWLWVQHWPVRKGIRTIHTVWIWDAEANLTVREWISPWNVSPKEMKHVSRSLLAVLKRRRGSYEIIHHLTSPSEKESSAPIQACQTVNCSISQSKPKASLITSFVPGGYLRAWTLWPSCSPACELYTFMQSDVACLADLCKTYDKRLRPDMSAIDLMASLARTPKAIGLIGKHVCDNLPTSARPVIALASFLPEVSASDKQLRSKGKDAVVFLLGLTRAIREVQGKGLPATVELVGGSLIDGIWPCILRPKDSNLDVEMSYVANRSRPVDSIARIVATLGAACLETKRLYGSIGSRIALELEPGPLYVLKDLEALEVLAKEINRHPLLRETIGFNLDVAHWCLSGASPTEKPLVPSSIWKRIVHAHVSDHGQGHFGDAMLGDCGLGTLPKDLDSAIAVFRSWLSVITELSTNSRGPARPPYSGFASVELEACRHPSHANISVDRLRSVLETL